LASHRSESGPRHLYLVGFSNPFCVLGLSADADGQTIQQATQRALMERRLGTATEKSTVEMEIIEQALEQLKDPKTRFLASLHWLVLNDNEQSTWGNSPRTLSLAFDDSRLSFDDYAKVASSSSVVVRSHNLAVLACASARRLTALGKIEKAAKIWAKGFKLWTVCLSSEEFIKQHIDHAHDLDDPRLTVPVVRELIRDIPQDLLAVPSHLASLSLDHRETEKALGLVDIVRNSPFEHEFIDRALESVYIPLAHRVETEIDSLDQRRRKLAASPPASDDSEINLKDWRELLNDFKACVAPDLEQMLELGDLPGLAEEHARDHAARFLHRLAIVSWNTTQMSELSNEAISIAIHLVDTTSLKSQLEDDQNKINKVKLASHANDLDLSIRSDRVTITTAGIRFNEKSIDSVDLDGLRFGIFKQYTNGIPTSCLYNIGYRSRKGTEITIKCKRLLRSEAKAQMDFSAIVGATLHQLAPGIVKRIVENIKNGRNCNMGYLCVLTPSGIRFSTGSLFWRADHLIPYPEVRYTISRGELLISSIYEKRAKITLSLLRDWNAVLFEYIVEAILVA